MNITAASIEHYKEVEGMVKNIPHDVKSHIDNVSLSMGDGLNIQFRDNFGSKPILVYGKIFKIETCIAEKGGAMSIEVLTSVNANMWRWTMECEKARGFKVEQRD